MSGKAPGHSRRRPRYAKDSGAGQTDTPKPPSATECLFAFAILFTFLFVTHAPLLRLPYFWDEAGYFIPAARDLLLTGSLIPHTTLSNAHPPLLMLWLAFWWKFSAFTPAVTRTAMLLMTAFGLTGLWRLARGVANARVALATVLCTALYPVFFAQSTMAHLDLMAAAFTFWGLAMYVERRRTAALAFFSLAALTKETAILAPLALFAWEALCPWIARRSRVQLCFARKGLREAAFWLLALVPLGLWLVYHHQRTGYFFGNPEYLRYNLEATLSPLRILLALLMRLWQVLGNLNLFLLTLGALEVMRRRPVQQADGETRQRIAIPIQVVFAATILAYVVGLAVAGGAVLARYMLPVVPLVILICVSTLHRRMRQWTWLVGFACAAFVVQLFVPPPYRIAPEDTLLYRDYILLHKLAADEISTKHPHAKVLTAWPASDELTRPFLGYVKKPLDVTRIENFSQPEMQRAAEAAGQFDYVLMFSTKWEPPHPFFAGPLFGRATQERFFDYHQDIAPQAAADLLGGRIVTQKNRNNEWIALIEIEKIENADVQNPPHDPDHLFRQSRVYTRVPLP